jgi:hypothetical protein
MIIQARAKELEWIRDDNRDFPDVYFSDIGDFQLRIFNMEAEGFEFSVSYLGEKFDLLLPKLNIESLKEAKSYAQQWADGLVASIAKSWVMPDKQENPDSEFYSGWNAGIQRVKKLNGVQE